MAGKIWERYFIRQTAAVMLLILACFFGLYVLIDYATRTSGSHIHTRIDFLQLAVYYFYEFSQRLDVLLPFALLVATIRTLTQLNAQNELVALLASGVKMKRLLLPFVLTGLTCTGIIYLNYQYIVPAALKEMRSLTNTHSQSTKKSKRKLTVESVALKDRSVLLFQDYDHANEQFVDAWWVKSFDEIYHFKTLSPLGPEPVGRFVDSLSRDKAGKLVKMNSFKEKTFPDMRFNDKILIDSLTPPEELSLTKLRRKLPDGGRPSSDKEAHLATVFYQKMAMPWLCLLAVLGPAPFCVRFSRTFPVFFIYAAGIFGMVALYILVDAAAVLGSRQVLPPFWAIVSPIVFFLSAALLRFARL